LSDLWSGPDALDESAVGCSWQANGAELEDAADAKRWRDENYRRYAEIAWSAGTVADEDG